MLLFVLLILYNSKAHFPYASLQSSHKVDSAWFGATFTLKITVTATALLCFPILSYPSLSVLFQCFFFSPHCFQCLNFCLSGYFLLVCFSRTLIPSAEYLAKPTCHGLSTCLSVAHFSHSIKLSRTFLPRVFLVRVVKNDGPRWVWKGTTFY